jgi:hypothetical protein
MNSWRNEQANDINTTKYIYKVLLQKEGRVGESSKRSWILCFFDHFFYTDGAHSHTVSNCHVLVFFCFHSTNSSMITGPTNHKWEVVDNCVLFVLWRIRKCTSIIGIVIWEIGFNFQTKLQKHFPLIIVYRIISVILLLSNKIERTEKWTIHTITKKHSLHEMVPPEIWEILS